MCGWIDRPEVRAAALIILLLPAGGAPAAETARIGTPLSAREIAAIDRDARFDGAGLPSGAGTVAEGEELYGARCAGCHGEFGEGAGRNPALLGGEGTLATARPVRTIGSFWPYAPTLFDYIRRAMPEGHAFSLTSREVHALTAHLLQINGIVDEDFVASATSLPQVRMPNRDGFIMPPHPRAQGKRCMKDCREGKARIIAEAPRETEGIMAGDREESR